MKKLSLILTLASAFLILLTTNVNAQQFDGLDRSPLDLAAFPGNGRPNKLVKVFYSRPYLKGRKLGTERTENQRAFVPYGKLWRTGANDATQIQFFEDMKLGNTTIKAGAYSLFTIPNEKEWVIIISSDLDNWATRGYKESNEVARLTVPVTQGEESLENFSIAFEGVDNGVHMHMGWGKTRVSVPFTK